LNYLLDTNVLSEMRRPRPDPKVAAWIAATPISHRYISALSLGEMSRGIMLLFDRDKERGEFYRDWLVEVRARYAGRTLPVDGKVAETWGVTMPLRSLPVFDALIAATARMHGLVLATRNRRDFERLGIKVLNPWTD
jgi:toxin FitB